MPKVIAYKSPHTGEIFEFEKDYKAHLKAIYRQRAMERKQLLDENSLAARWEVFRNQISEVSQLPKAILEHQDLFWETASQKRYGWDFDICRKIDIMPRLVEFTEFSLRYSEHVSNTHSCPHNGVTNWGGRVEGAPRGYPGWSGRIGWIVEWPREHGGNYPGGQLLKGSRIHTGTGGGGGTLIREGKDCQSFAYGVEIFAADWDKLAKNVFLKQLKGEKI